MVKKCLAIMMALLVFLTLGLPAYAEAGGGEGSVLLDEEAGKTLDVSVRVIPHSDSPTEVTVAWDPLEFTFMLEYESLAPISPNTISGTWLDSNTRTITVHNGGHYKVGASVHWASEAGKSEPVLSKTKGGLTLSLTGNQATLAPGKSLSCSLELTPDENFTKTHYQQWLYEYKPFDQLVVCFEKVS